MSANTNDLGESLSAADYLRQRYDPRPGDADYLQLSDLRLALEQFRSDEALSVLDYGCGGSPYKQLFATADYRRADYIQASGLDYVISEDGKIPETSKEFDLVFSTQVAEHVGNPSAYFAECLRLLKPGGRFICSTHGSYIDHGCPYDYQRWTPSGLRRDLEEAGFEIDSIAKLTTGPRALFYFFDRFGGWMATNRTNAFGFAIWLARDLSKRFRPAIHRQCDRIFASNRIVTDSIGSQEHSLYVVLLAVAKRPLELV